MSHQWRRRLPNDLKIQSHDPRPQSPMRNYVHTSIIMTYSNSHQCQPQNAAGWLSYALTTPSPISKGKVDRETTLIQPTAKKFDKEEKKSVCDD
jgi:hypothetical protein